MASVIPARTADPFGGRQVILGLLAGVAWFGIFLAGHFLALRIFGPAVRPRATQLILMGGIVALPFSLAHPLSLPFESDLAQGGWLMGTIWGWLTLIGLFVMYMPFYYTVVASLSVKTIILLSRRQDFAMPLSTVRGQFVSRALVAQRLQTMKDNGFLVETSNGYALTPKGRTIATLFSAVKRVWKLGAGG